MFKVNRAAPRIDIGDEDVRLLEGRDRENLLGGAAEICESVQDNDAERWFLSEGGQFLRVTGLDAERCYVTSPAYALDMLAGFCDDAVMEKLVEANAFQGAVTPGGRSI